MKAGGWRPGLLLCLLLGAAAWLQSSLALPTGPAQAADAVPSPQAVRRWSLGYDGLAADLYWTRAVQYFGRLHRAHSSSYPQLAPLVRLTVALDPDLMTAAENGAFFLADDAPLGAGHPRQAVALLQQAIARHPRQWRLYYDLGFVCALDLHDRKQAAAAFAAGARQPGANPILATLAAFYYGQTDEKLLALALWQSIATGSSDPLVRQNARTHIQQLKKELRGN